MKKGYRNILIIELIFFAVLFFCNFVFNIKSSLIYTLIYILSFILSYILIGFEKDRFRYKTDILLTTVIYTLAFFIITYLFSLPFGYVKNSYSLSFINIIKNISPVIINIVVLELFRYNIVTKSKGFKLGIFLSVILFILVDALPQFNVLLTGSYKSGVEYICGLVVPSVFKNILLTYVTYKVGYKTPIIYRFIFELTLYLLPIFPGYGTYITAVLNIVFPFILFMKLKSMFDGEKPKQLEYRSKNIVSKVILSTLIILSVISILLNSGLIKYFCISVGSDSMKKTINTGDVVVAKKIKNPSEIKEKDIILFEKENKLVIHRVIDVIKMDGKYYYQTKGDNNKEPDNYLVNEKELKGIMKFKVRFIGWPSVWLTKSFEGGK